jgi:hypothetical protein
MAIEIRLRLGADDGQRARLLALQVGFAELCNAIAPFVRQTRVWNRVALHHMVYRSMRERYPAMGSQMVCNAVYAVSRASRHLFQSPGSPLHHTRFANRPLPLIRFTERCPVYFDRHTLSIKDGQLSMFTLDGRMKFELSVSAAQQQALTNHRVQEIMLLRQSEMFELRIQLDEAANPDLTPEISVPATSILDNTGVRARHPMAVVAPPAPPVSLDEFVSVEDLLVGG